MTTLSDYLTQTRRLLQNPSAQVALYNDTDLTDYVNTARTQVAAEGECLRALVSFQPQAGNSGPYAFSTIHTGVQGYASVFKVPQIYPALGGAQPVVSRSWEWFVQYYITSDATANVPTDYAQYGQGSSGSLLFNPTPGASPQVLILDCICLPTTLTSPSQNDLAIPALWDVPVPYFAAYQALLSAQMQARWADAQRMLELYETFMARARGFATPAVLPTNYEQVPNPTRANQLATSGPQGGAGPG